MFDFIKNALAELTHVVWPTRKESGRYMAYTVGTIVIVGLFLSILGYAIRLGMMTTRNQFPHETPTTSTVSGEDFATKADLEALTQALSGRTQSGSNTVSGATIIPTSSGITLSGSAR